MSFHYVANTHGDYTSPAALGFNLIDVSSINSANSLPAGCQALIYVGHGTVMPSAADKALYTAGAANSKVWGFFVVDEPAVSAAGVAAVKAHCDFIRSVSGGKKKSFITLDSTTTPKSYNPATVGADWYGLDPYPVSVNGYKTGHVAERVNAAVAAGIPKAQIAPIYQCFGQEALAVPYYVMPTAAQFSKLLAEWDAVVPNPGLDYCYGWGHQSSANPTLVDNVSMQQKLKARFAGTGTVTPPPPPPVTPPIPSADYLAGKAAAYADMRKYIQNK